MSNRRFLIKSIVAGIAGMLPIQYGLAQEGASFNSAEIRTGRNTVSLEDQLMNGLRVTTPNQRAYVKYLVLVVERGKLPRAMVNLVYTWALERNPSVPFPYFKIAMRILAKRRGVDLP